MRTVNTSLPLALGLLAACGGAVPPRAAPPPAAPAPIAATSAESVAEYRISPGDVIDVRFTFHPEMDLADVTVRPDGRVSLPEFGDVAVAGLTPAAVEKAITERTSSRLRAPEVRVTLRRQEEKTVYVAGEVGRPGRLVYRADLTPLQAIVEAGGLLDTAAIDSVVLVRGEAASDRVSGRKIDLESAIADGGGPLRLEPYDVVYVPKTSIAEVNLWIDQHVTRLFPFIRGASARIPMF